MPNNFLIKHKSNFLFLFSLLVIVLAGYLTFMFNAGLPKPISKNEIDSAVNKAKRLYSEEKSRKKDFSNGPCLSDALLPNWVVDIAHNPRLPIDDLPQNQCPSYVEGRSQHFVELDLNGDLIRAK